MTWKNAFYRAGSWLLHRLTAHHTGGYGIHSPYLFYIARLILPDDSRYYAFDRIERRAAELRRSQQSIYVEDFGTGVSGQRKVADILQNSVTQRRYAEILFKLVNFAHAQRILELGTSLGLTTAYLALPNQTAQVRTLEGSLELKKLAEENWRKTGVKNATCICGKIDDTLYNNIEREWKTVDFAYIDANHTEKATWEYFSFMTKHVTPHSIVVIDDIHSSPEMGRAWQRIKEHADVTTTFDLWQMGIVFFDKQFMRKHYKIRV